MKRLFGLLTLILLLLPISVNAQQFTVRTLYFQASDAPAPPSLKIINLLTQTQEFYRAEMERHGYSDKTFKLETDGAGNIGFHHVRGKQKSGYYTRDTYNRVKSELPSQFARNPNSQDNVLLLIVGGLKYLDNGGIGYSWSYSGKRTGGVALIAGNDLFFRLIAHEIGHTFGLNHTDVRGAIMGAGEDMLLDYNAYWLDRHHLFNDTHTEPIYRVS